jgi:hypothetical protein
LNIRTNTYINSKVRNGQRVGDPNGFVIGLQRYIEEYYQKEADKVKTQKVKMQRLLKVEKFLNYLILEMLEK